MVLDLVTLSRMIFCRTALSRMALSIVTINDIVTLTRMALSRVGLSRKHLG